MIGWRAVVAWALLGTACAQNKQFGIFRQVPTVKPVNPACERQMEAFFDGLNQDKSWALRMYDANSKWNYGLLTGNLKDYGNFDQCLRVRYPEDNPDILGKHCTYGLLVWIRNPLQGEPTSKKLDNEELEFFHPETKALVQGHFLDIKMSLCIPSACEPKDLQGYISLDVDFMTYNNLFCQTDGSEEKLDAGDITAIVILGVVMVLVLASTIYDYYLFRTKQETAHLIFLAFSVLTNGRKVLKTSKISGQLTALNGLRSISILWVMAGHRFSVQPVMPMVNAHNIDNWMRKPTSQYILGAPIAVDTFLFISGCLTAYGFIKSQSRPHARFNLFMYYLHRYLRITPALAFLYMFHVTLIRHFTDGPMYPEIFRQIRSDCLDSWWAVFLYVQNYVNREHMCMLHTWYLSMDMHLYILSPALMIPLIKWTKQMVYVLVGLIVVSMIVPFVIVFHFEIEMFTDDYYNLYYYVTHTRLAPWLIGLFAGGVIFIYKDQNVKIHTVVNVTIWVVVLFGMCNIIYWGNDVHNNFNVWSSSFYLATHRGAWALGLSWITFACLKGYGGFVDWFLSQPFFQVMARISYSMYLVHFSVLAVHLARQRTPLMFLDYEIIYQSLGDCVVTTVVAFFWVVLFESPMVVVEKILFTPRPPKKKLEEPEEAPEKPDEAIVDLAKASHQA